MKRGKVGREVALDGFDSLEATILKHYTGVPVVVTPIDETVVRVVAADEVVLIDLERRLEAAFDDLTHLDYLPKHVRDYREAAIDGWLKDEANLTAAFRAIPTRWVCVADCPDKFSFVAIYLYERYGVIEMAEDVGRDPELC